MAIWSDIVMKKFFALSFLFLLATAGVRAESPEPELAGTLIQRPNGTFLQMVMEGNRFHFYFFDAEKKPMAPDVDRISVRMRSVRDKPRFTVAVPFEGINGLRAPYFVTPPHIFIAYLNLMRDGVEDPVETHVVNVGNAPATQDPNGMLPDGS
jgi:hypothetical protein